MKITIKSTIFILGLGLLISCHQNTKHTDDFNQLQRKQYQEIDTNVVSEPNILREDSLLNMLADTVTVSDNN